MDARRARAAAVNVNVNHGRAAVMWNDDGRPCELICGGTRLIVDTEKELRELHEVLGFLFDKPASPAPRS